MRIREYFKFTTTGVLLGAYSGLGLFVTLVSHGIYNEFYAKIIGETPGAGIVQTAIAGAVGAILVLSLTLLATGAGTARKARCSRKPYALTGIVNAGVLFGIGAFVFYETPYAFNEVDLAILFTISGVVGVSTFTIQYDWRLSEIRNNELKLKDLEFAHKDALQSLHLITWTCIIFLTGGVIAALSTFGGRFAPGTPPSSCME